MTKTKGQLLCEIAELKMELMSRAKELEMLRYKLSIAERDGKVGETLPLFTVARRRDIESS